jgi:hypothetical protein
MACLESSVAQGSTNVPAASGHVSAAGVANLAPPPQRCSIFYRTIGLIEDFLRLSPYGEFVFAARASAHGLSRSRKR